MIDISGINNGPSVLNVIDNYIIKSNKILTQNIGANDIDGDLLSYTISSMPKNGTIVVDLNGNWSYTANTNYVGNDNSIITISDGKGASITKTLNFTINNILNGGAKNDTIIQTDSQSSDTIDGGDGIDTLDYSSMSRTIFKEDFTSGISQSSTDYVLHEMKNGIPTTNGNGHAQVITDSNMWLGTSQYGKDGSTDKFMFVDGAINNSKYVYKRDVNLVQGQTYSFSFDATQNNGVMFDLIVGNSKVSNSVILDQGGWKTYNISFVARKSGLQTIGLRDININSDGNDFGIDNIELKTGVIVDLSSKTIDKGNGVKDSVVNVENVIGTQYSDTIIGDSNNNTFYGSAGNDTMKGGLGDDTYVVDNVIDVIVENANEGIDTIQSSTTYSLSSNVENLTLTGTSSINGTGNILNNIIIGNSGNNTLYGEAGDDTLIGDAGDDTYNFFLGSGKDIITDTKGIDNILFGSSILESNIAFYLQSDNNLAIKYSDNDSITVSSWSNTSNKIEMFQLSYGKYLTSTDIDNLIQSMSAYATSKGISLSSVDSVSKNADLMTMIADAWHSIPVPVSVLISL